MKFVQSEWHHAILNLCWEFFMRQRRTKTEVCLDQMTIQVFSMRLALQREVSSGGGLYRVTVHSTTLQERV